MKTFTYFPASKKLQKWPAAELSISTCYFPLLPTTPDSLWIPSLLAMFLWRWFIYLFIFFLWPVPVCLWVFGGEHTGGYLILSAACFSLNSYCGPWGPGDTHLQEPHFTEHCLLENSLNTLSHNISTNNSAQSKPSESMDTQILKKTFHTQASNTDRLLLHMRTSLQTFSCMHECNTMMSRHSMWIRKREEWFYHFTTIK